MLPLDVEMPVYQVGLLTVTEVLHEAGDERKDLVFRAGVSHGRVHRGMETLLSNIVPGPFVALEKVVDCFPVRAFHIRVTDEFRHPMQDLPFVVIEGRPAGRAG